MILGNSNYDYDELLKHANAHLHLREAEASKDPLRPIYHICPPGNWMNDPHGAIKLTYSDEQPWYHLFYQVNPFDPTWGNISWGHVASRDLVQWEHRPLALVPGPPGWWDSSGVFSGCCVPGSPNGTRGVKATILYTGVLRTDPSRDFTLDEQVQCMATSKDKNLLCWANFEEIIEPNSHPEYNTTPRPPELDCMRDPFVWKHGNDWYMLLGSAVVDNGECKGNALLYKYESGNWEFKGKFCDQSLGRNWECCNYIPPSALGGGADANNEGIIIISPEYRVDDPTNSRAKEKRHVMWAKGTLDLNKTSGPYFTITKMRDEYFHILDYGTYEGFYAATTLQDNGSCILWGWSTGGGTPGKPWDGVLTLPRELKWEGKDLSINPLSGTNGLRGKHITLDPEEIEPETLRQLAAVEGDCLEIEVKGNFSKGAELLISLWGDKHGNGSIPIVLRPSDGLVKIGCFADCLGPIAKPTTPPTNEVTIRLFLDRSIIELYLNGRYVVTRRIMPKNTAGKHVRIAVRATSSGPVKLTELQAWQMKSIWQKQ